jgi:ribosomal protein S18 acetylase RimI-like enzyme
VAKLYRPKLAGKKYRIADTEQDILKVESAKVAVATGEGCMENSNIRRARPADVDAILGLWQVAAATPGVTETPEDVFRALATENTVVLLAFVSGKIVGSVIAGFDGWRGNIYRLAVAPTKRRSGIATALVREAERVLIGLGAKRVTALVEKDHGWAVQFWDAVGYSFDGRIVRHVRNLLPQTSGPCRSRLRIVASTLSKRSGLWFPVLVKLLDLLYRKLSLGHHLNVAMDTRYIGGAWVSEIYLMAAVLIGSLWLALLPVPVPVGPLWTVIGVSLALYRPSEIAIYAMHWLLVARGPVKDYRRSLVSFLANLLELGIFFAIAFTLLQAFGVGLSNWQVLRASLQAVFTLSTPDGLAGGPWSARLAVGQVVIAWLLAVLIVANVVGGIARGERADKDSKVRF